MYYTTSTTDCTVQFPGICTDLHALLDDHDVTHGRTPSGRDMQFLYCLVQMDFALDFDKIMLKIGNNP